MVGPGTSLSLSRILRAVATLAGRQVSRSVGPETVALRWEKSLRNMGKTMVFLPRKYGVLGEVSINHPNDDEN